MDGFLADFLLPAQGGGVSLRKVRRSLVFGILGILSFAWATSVHAHTLVEDHFDHGIDEEIWRVYRSSETGLIQTIAGKLFIYDVMPSDYTVHQNRLLGLIDRKSTRLNSSHVAISYAVFCLKKKRDHI